jgi:hypothetical protein
MGRRFNDTEGIKKLTALKAIPQQELQNVFNNGSIVKLSTSKVTPLSKLEV